MKVTLAVAMIVLVCGYVAANTANVYCGRRLSNVLAALCWDSEMMKRDPEMVKRDPELVKRNAGWWTPSTRLRSLGGMRGKRGPVDECCDKPCTIDELLTYC